MFLKLFLLLLSSSFISVQSHDICNFSVTISTDLEFFGFHRQFKYNIIFENHSVDKSEKPVYYYDECILAVQQHLPAGIYVDPDELENLRRANELSAYPDSGVSIEAATPHSRPFNAYIFAAVEKNTVRTYLPAHARYHKPSYHSNVANNTIKEPSTFLRCPDNRLERCDMRPRSNQFLCKMDGSKNKKCHWKEVVVKPSNMCIIWQVPTGNLNHYHLVELVTFLALVGSSVALLQIILAHPITSRMNFVMEPIFNGM